MKQPNIIKIILSAKLEHGMQIRSDKKTGRKTMQNTGSINCLYNDYAAGLIDKKRFEGIIFKMIYENYSSLTKLGREDFDEFISWLYPRVSRAVDNYQDTGTSFEVYMDNLIHMAAKEYRWSRIRDYNTETAALITQIPDIYACESDAGYYASGLNLRKPVSVPPVCVGKRKTVRNSRQVLTLVLKCCRYVSDDFLERIAPRLGMKPEALRAMFERLNENRQKREASFERLRKLANLEFCRCVFYERGLPTLKDNPIAFRRMEMLLERHRARLCRTRAKLAKTPLEPSNAKIAEVLGVTKGTVDAALHTLKVKWGYDKATEKRHILN